MTRFGTGLCSLHTTAPSRSSRSFCLSSMSAVAEVTPYLALLKPAKLLRLFGAVSLAAVVALPLSRSDVTLAAIAVVAGCFVAAGANALNMFIDRDLDARDRRTIARPLPAGEVLPWTAL